MGLMKRLKIERDRIISKLERGGFEDEAEKTKYEVAKIELQTIWNVAIGLNWCPRNDLRLRRYTAIYLRNRCSVKAVAVECKIANVTVTNQISFANAYITDYLIEKRIKDLDSIIRDLYGI